MIPFKAKVEKTGIAKGGEMLEIKGNVGKGYALKLQALFYSSSNPGHFLHLLDADGDEFMFPIPGQGQPKAINPAIPITVKLPLKYVDISQGDNQIIIWGEAEKITNVESGM